MIPETEPSLTIVTNPLFRLHQTPPGHPESVSRIDWAIEGVERAGLAVESVEVLPEATDRLIAKTHSENYARELDRACLDGASIFDCEDNPVSRSTGAAARAAVGTSLAAAERIWNAKTSKRAFVIARPPGHHAERTTAMGFCFYNTIAVVAEYLREQPGISRVFILDWDVHHGNGTQHLFEDREDVFYSSIHRFPFYPGTGASRERGVDAGMGTTLNLPMPGGIGDAEWLGEFEAQLPHAIDDYRPDAILISAGFDAHRNDPLGGMRLSTDAYRQMTRTVVDLAYKHCDGRVLSLLEGGYDREGMAASVAVHLDELRRTGPA